MNCSCSISSSFFLSHSPNFIVSVPPTAAASSTAGVVGGVVGGAGLIALIVAIALLVSRRRRQALDDRHLELAQYYPQGARIAYIPEHDIPRLPEYARFAVNKADLNFASEPANKPLSAETGHRRLWLSNMHVSKTNLGDSDEHRIINASFSSNIFWPKPKLQWTASTLVRNVTNVNEVPLSVVSGVWNQAESHCDRIRKNTVVALSNPPVEASHTDEDNLPVDFWVPQSQHSADDLVEPDVMDAGYLSIEEINRLNLETGPKVFQLMLSCYFID